VNPLKVEVHNLSPLIVQYYDVVGEREMTQLKDEVSGEMRMSRIMRSPEDEIGVGAVSRQRTSSNAWAKDFEHPKFHELLLKIGRILNVTTGKVCSTENMQIAAYRYYIELLFIKAFVVRKGGEVGKGIFIIIVVLEVTMSPTLMRCLRKNSWIS